MYVTLLLQENNIKSTLVTLNILPEQCATTVISFVVIVFLRGPLAVVLTVQTAVVTVYSFAFLLVWSSYWRNVSSSSSQHETAKCNDENKGQKGQLWLRKHSVCLFCYRYNRVPLPPMNYHLWRVNQWVCAVCSLWMFPRPNLHWNMFCYSMACVAWGPSHHYFRDVRPLLITAVTAPISASSVLRFVYVVLREKFLEFDWLRAVVIQRNLKYLHVKITNLWR